MIIGSHYRLPQVSHACCRRTFVHKNLTQEKIFVKKGRFTITERFRFLAQKRLILFKIIIFLVWGSKYIMVLDFEESGSFLKSANKVV